MSQKFDIRITDKHVIPQSVFVARNTNPNHMPNSVVSETETRIRRALPDGLKALYGIQNGGQINNLCIPIKAGTEFLYDDVCFPFGGYNDLNPLERLKTLKEHILGYASEDDPEQVHEFPNRCENMIVLARWHDRTLFLDYNDSPDAKVCFADFGTPEWQSKAIIWDNFSSFFHALRHYEE